MKELIERFIVAVEALPTALTRIADALERDSAPATGADQPAKTRTRRTKEQIAADNAAAAQTPPPVQAPPVQAPAAVQTQPAAPVAPVAPIPAPAAGEPTLNDVRAQLVALAADKSEAVAFKILSDRNIPNISSIPPTQYREILMAVAAVRMG